MPSTRRCRGVIAPERRAFRIGAVVGADRPTDRELRDRRDVELLVEAAQTARHLQAIRDVVGQLAENRGIPKMHPAIVLESGICRDRHSVKCCGECAPAENVILLGEELLLVLIERTENPIECAWPWSTPSGLPR